ncbi:MAG: cobyrinic acid a,c-diamide synthase [Gammaproteobacteria bacterium]|nr:MAG: cobyrinic acid a,c-diamide synthase [Gammaproteobacteria bacterium]
MSALKPVKVISVSGGKGGVGKSNVTINIAISLAKMGKKVMIMDADLGLANIDIMLGLRVTQNLSHVLKGECELEDIILEGPEGIKIIPASSGTKEMAQLSEMEHVGLIRAFGSLSSQIDVLIVDTAAGIADNVISFAQASQDLLMVICDEPTSITDAYALMKILSMDHGIFRFRIVANMIRNPKEGRNLFAKLTRVTDQFLDVALDYVGSIPFDENVRKSVRKQQALVTLYPSSPAAVAMKKLATKINEWPVPRTAKGNIEFFMERLVQGGVLD